MTTNRVLLADRDEALLAVYREFLLRDGFDVLTATDGVDCVGKLRTFLPQTLVLDPDLLWGGGEGVLAMIYEDSTVPFIPVLVLADRPDPRGHYGVGVFPVSVFHTKPLPPYRLAQSLHALLHPRRLGLEVHWGEEVYRPRALGV